MRALFTSGVYYKFKFHITPQVYIFLLTEIFLFLAAINNIPVSLKCSGMWLEGTLSGEEAEVPWVLQYTWHSSNICWVMVYIIFESCSTALSNICHMLGISVTVIAEFKWVILRFLWEIQVKSSKRFSLYQSFIFYWWVIIFYETLMNNSKHI